jgi:hypothetical protein
LTNSAEMQVFVFRAPLIWVIDDLSLDRWPIRM